MMLEWVLSAVQQLQDLITNSSYEQVVNKNKDQKEEVDVSIHHYLNWTHHSGNESWMPGKLFSLFPFWTTCLPWKRLSLALESNCEMWIWDKFMYHFMLERGWKWFFCEDFEVWFCNLAYLQKQKKEEKDQYSQVDHTGKTHHRLFLYTIYVT